MDSKILGSIFFESCETRIPKMEASSVFATTAADATGPAPSCKGAGITASSTDPVNVTASVGRTKLAAQLRIADTDVQLTCVYQGTAEEEAIAIATMIMGLIEFISEAMVVEKKRKRAQQRPFAVACFNMTSLDGCTECVLPHSLLVHVQVQSIMSRRHHH